MFSLYLNFSYKYASTVFYEIEKYTGPSMLITEKLHSTK